jgi:signal transduction histidine kinase
LNQDYTRKLKQLVPILLVALAIIGATVAIHGFAFLSIDDWNGKNLSKGWKYCHPTDSADLTTKCEAFEVQLPDNEQRHYRHLIAGNRAEYRNTFTTPAECIDRASNGCTLFLGGVYQGVEAILNGQSLGIQFTRSDLHSASFLIPKQLLKSENKENNITLIVFTDDAIRHPSVAQGPIGILSTRTAEIFAAGIIGERIILPLMGAAINLTFALVAFFWLLSTNASKSIIYYYIAFCITAAAYLFNATRIPREFLGYQAGMSLNFALRYTMDLTFFLLTTSFYNISGRKIKFVNLTYALAITIFLLFIILSTASETIAQLLNQPISNSHIGLRSGNFIYLTACAFTPLMLGGKVAGLIYATKYGAKDKNSLILFLLFLILTPLQLVDILTFLNLIRVNHEIYYMRMYTPYISLAFGYVIWQNWLKRERDTEATIRAGEVALGVAHDLRSPLSVLNLLAKSKQNFEHDEKLLFTTAIDSLTGITNELLGRYRIQNRDNNLDQDPNTKLLPIEQVLAEIVRESNLLNSKQYRPNISFISSAEIELFCKMQPLDFARIMNNILNNAIDATLECSHAIEPQILVELHQRDSFALITISNSGLPVDKTLIDRLNNGDFRTSKSNGHGIGLKEVTKRLRFYGGTIRFDSRKNGGLTVQIDIPVETIGAS